MNKLTKSWLHLLVGVQAGLLTVSAGQFALDAIHTGPRTVTFSSVAETTSTLPEVAHRGLFGDGTVESTPAAMTAAIKAKYFGVEFDVRLTSDKRAVVIHDTTFARVAPQCAKYGEVKSQTLKTAQKCGMTSLEDMIIHIQAQGKKYKWTGSVYVHVKVTLSSGTAGGLVNRLVPLDNEKGRAVFMLEDEKNQPRLKTAGWKGRQGLMVHTEADWALVSAPTGPFTVAVAYGSVITPEHAATMKTLKRELWGMPGYPQSAEELTALPITGLFV